MIQVGLDSSGFNTPSVVDQNVRTNVNVNQNAAEDDFDNPAIKLREIKLKNPNNPSLAYINVKSIRNKHSDMFTFLDCNIDILTIAETKLDCTFPTAQFIVEGYKEPFRKDRKKNSGGLLVYVKEDIPSRELKNHPLVPDLLDIVVIGLNFRKQKWLLISLYISSLNRIIFYDAMSKVIDFYSRTYTNIILMGDFNTRPDDKNFRAFYEGHDLFDLIKDKTCFKSASGTCIYLIFTNRKFCLRNTCTIDTGVSDFHRMIFTQLMLTFQKLPPKTIFFRDYKNFDQENFDKDLILSLMCNINVSSNYAQFSELFGKVLDKHAPLKKRKVRGNQMPFMTKTLRQAVMRRSKLFHTFTRSKKQSDWENFRKQRNHCVKLRNKVRKTFLNILHPNEVNKNNFWKTLGPFLWNKSIKQARKIILLEKNEIVSDDREVAEVFMKYFSTIRDNKRRVLAQTFPLLHLP